MKMCSSELILAGGYCVLLICGSLFAGNETAGWVLFLLFVADLLAILHSPRRLLERRLNDNFIVVHYIFSKWHEVYQQPKQIPWYSRKAAVRSRGLNDCKAFYHALTGQIDGLFSPAYFPKGFYRMTTHDVFKRRLEEKERHGLLRVLTCEPIYSKNIQCEQEALLRRSCLRCPDTGNCLFKKFSATPRQFYYIEFEVL